MNKHLKTLTICLFIGMNFLNAQYIHIEDYFPNKAGDWLEFQQNAESAYTLAFSNQDSYDLFGWIACNKNNKSIYLENKEKKSGWNIHQIIQPGEKRIICTQALEMLPANAEMNKLYEHEVSAQTFENGIRQKKGTLSSKVSILDQAAQETALGTLKDCILIQRTLHFKQGKNIHVEEWKEWYAKGIGLIQAEGNTYLLEKKGIKTNQQTINLSIDKALLQGKAIIAKN